MKVKLQKEFSKDTSCPENSKVLHLKVNVKVTTPSAISWESKSN